MIKFQFKGVIFNPDFLDVFYFVYNNYFYYGYSILYSTISDNN